jgi:hypothetical protein
VHGQEDDMTPCTPNVEKAGLSREDAEQLIQRISNLNKAIAKSYAENPLLAIREIAGELGKQENLLQKVQKRNSLLMLSTKRNAKDFIRRFKTKGEGLLTFLEGASGTTQGSRFSIDGQTKALHLQYFGGLVKQLEEQGLMARFKSKDKTRNIFIEMGELGRRDGKPGVTGDEEAVKIAKLVEGLTSKMVARQNRAGAYILKIPGYIIRQTHDIQAIRSLGGEGNSLASKTRSYALWKEFTLPLLDIKKTFDGADVKKVLRDIHEGLYTGIHGPEHDEQMVRVASVIGDLAKKVSAERVLHFKDADAAWKYNEMFGVKDFKEAVLSDIHHRARSIALMENLGPNPEANLKNMIRELEEEGRLGEDAAKQVDSLRDWRIMAAYNELSGKNETPANPTLSRVMGNVRILAQLAKMGGVVLSAFSDRAFLQAEASYQGISHLQTLVQQIKSFLPKTGDTKQALRLMGIGLDGLLGNALSRYSSHTTTGGLLHEVQRKFFSLNFLNQWTDASKSAAGELFAAHLGEHAGFTFDKLPDDLRKILTMYDISPKEWDALRMTAKTIGDTGATLLMPTEVAFIPVENIAEIADSHGLRPTDANLARTRDQLEAKLRVYLTDRVDIAIPTPGVAERKYATMNTQAGTPLGEAVRMLMLFKSFPLTILNRVMGREIYGNGAQNFRQWLLHDTKGKFHLAQLMAMGVAAGYISGAIRDMLKGRNPKPLLTDDGKINWETLNDAAIRGGSLGTLGDVLLQDYDRGYRGFLSQMAGPIAGQFDTAMDIKTRITHGQEFLPQVSQLALDNTPLLNLFYIRPVMDYLILWNLEEAMSPGSLVRMERAVEKRTGQTFWLHPSESK